MIAHLHRLPPGPVDLANLPTDATPGFDGNRKWFGNLAIGQVR